MSIGEIGPSLSQRGSSPGLRASYGAAFIAFAAALGALRPLFAGPPVHFAAKALLGVGIGCSVGLLWHGALVLAAGLRAGRATTREVVVGASVFAGALAVYGFWLLGQWPGMFMSDSAACVKSIATDVLDEWYSYTFLWYWRALALLGRGSPGAVGAVQAVATAVGVTVVTVFLLRQRAPRWLVLGSAALFVLSPANAINTIMLNRDWLFGWCHLALALAVPMLTLGRGTGGAPRKALPLPLAVGLVVLLAWTARLRGDGIVLLLVVPLAYAFAGVTSRRGAAVLGVAAVGLFVVINGPLARALHAERPTIRYSVTTILNPLGAIMRDPHYTPDAVEGKFIEAVVPTSSLKGKHIPYELPGLRDVEVTEAKGFSRLARATAQLAWDNPDLFLGSRTITFLATLGLSYSCFRYDDGSSMRADWIGKMLEQWGVQKHPIVPAFFRMQERILDATTTYRGLASTCVLVWSSLFALVVSIVALVRFRRAKRTAAAAFIILARVPLIFLFEPAAQFKYLYSLYMFGFFVIAFYLAERAWLRERFWGPAAA